MSARALGGVSLEEVLVYAAARVEEPRDALRHAVRGVSLAQNWKPGSPCQTTRGILSPAFRLFSRVFYPRPFPPRSSEFLPKQVFLSCPGNSFCCLRTAFLCDFALLIAFESMKIYCPLLSSNVCLKCASALPEASCLNEFSRTLLGCSVAAAAFAL